ncbi:MAG: hypothetical protein WAO02_06715 [Verrucomicrobiia bacterium]
MKINVIRAWAAVGVSVLTMTAALKASADDAAMAGIPHKSYTGTVVSVDAKEHLLGLKGTFLSKTFNLGENCSYTLVDKPAGAISDLRPGQRVMVVYQESHGVLVADRVTQQPVSGEGTVKAYDPIQHTLTLHGHGADRTFQIAGDCKVVLRGDKSGGLADIQTGNYVTVTYENPGNKPTAWKIAQTSETFTGSLTAIDLDTKTVKAKALFDTKKFSLGDNCAIVINGKINGQLADLKPNDKLVFSYDEIDGVNVANRIAPAGTAQRAETTPLQSTAQ